MKIVINPKYCYLTDFIHSLPDKNPVAEEVFQKERNHVYKVTVEDTPLVVKKYKWPTLANCVIYTWFRMGKAERSYKYAFRLKEMGFETAGPVAYIILKKYGFLHTCYFVSEFLPYPLLSTCVNYDRQILLNLVNDFAEYTYHLHKSGIVHNDYNLSNIMFRKEDGKYRFAIIDLNRIVFEYKFNKKHIDGLKGVGLPLPLLSIFIERYTRLAVLNTEIFFGSLLLKRGIHFTQRIKRRYKMVMKWLKTVFATSQ